MQTGQASPSFARPRSASLPALGTRIDRVAGTLAGKTVRIGEQAAQLLMRPAAPLRAFEVHGSLAQALMRLERRGAAYDKVDAAAFLARHLPLLLQGDCDQPLPDTVLERYYLAVLADAQASLKNAQQRAAVGRALGQQLDGHAMPPERRAWLLACIARHAAEHDPDLRKTASVLMGVAEGTTRGGAAPTDEFQAAVVRALAATPGPLGEQLLRGWCAHQAGRIEARQLRIVIAVALDAGSAMASRPEDLVRRLQALIHAFSQQPTLPGLLARHLARAGLDAATTAQLFSVLIASLPSYQAATQCMQAVLESSRIDAQQVTHAFLALPGTPTRGAGVESKSTPAGQGAGLDAAELRRKLCRMLPELPKDLAATLLARLAYVLGRGPAGPEALGSLRVAIFESQKALAAPPLKFLVLGYALGVPGGPRAAGHQLTISAKAIEPHLAESAQIEEGLALAADPMAPYAAPDAPRLSVHPDADLALRMHAGLGLATAVTLDRLHDNKNLPTATKVDHMCTVLDSAPGALTQANLRSLRERVVTYARAPSIASAAALRLARMADALRGVYASFVAQRISAAYEQLCGGTSGALRAGAQIESLRVFLQAEHAALSVPGLPWIFAAPVRQALRDGVVQADQILSNLGHSAAGD